MCSLLRRQRERGGERRDEKRGREGRKRESSFCVLKS